MGIAQPTQAPHPNCPSLLPPQNYTRLEHLLDLRRSGAELPEEQPTFQSNFIKNSGNSYEPTASLLTVAEYFKFRMAVA